MLWHNGVMGRFRGRAGVLDSYLLLLFLKNWGFSEDSLNFPFPCVRISWGSTDSCSKQRVGSGSLMFVAFSF